MEQDCYLGANSSDILGELIDKYRAQRILLVRGESSYSISGAEKCIGKAINDKSIELIDFHDFHENPKIEDVEKGLSVFFAKEVDLIIGIGGGSVIDMSKLIRFFHSYDTNDEFTDYSQKNRLIPLIALPTTAGSGSESTRFAVVYKNRRKYSVEHENVLPDIAIIDPVFTYKNPKYLTACTGFDALAQAIEAYWNVNATKESEGYSIKAIDLLWPNLPDAVNSPTEELRNKISEGSNWAGKAINITKTTAPHAFSYPFTIYYGYPHGHAVALTFPQFMKINYPNQEYELSPSMDIQVYQNKMNLLYDILGISTKNEAFMYMTDYIGKLGLSLQIPHEINKNVIIDNINTQRLSNNPIKIYDYMKTDIVNRISNSQNLLKERFNPEGSTLRRHQLKMLELLKYVDRICKENNIRYWLNSGTLLGAVRHEGFIPWDDDLDIEMLKHDYDRFIEILEKEQSADYVLQTHKTDNNYVAMYAKLRDLKSVIKEDNKNDCFYKNKGIYIDIFCLEPSTYFLARLSSICHFFVFKASHIERNSLRKIMVWFSYFLTTKFLYPIFRFVSKFSNPSLLRYTFGSGIPFPRYKSEIFPLKEIAFENNKFPAPQDCDSYLRHIYGDYMKLPDLDKIERHVLQVDFR